MSIQGKDLSQEKEETLPWEKFTRIFLFSTFEIFAKQRQNQNKEFAQYHNVAKVTLYHYCSIVATKNTLWQKKQWNENANKIMLLLTNKQRKRNIVCCQCWCKYTSSNFTQSNFVHGFSGSPHHHLFPHNNHNHFIFFILLIIIIIKIIFVLIIKSHE